MFELVLCRSSHVVMMFSWEVGAGLPNGKGAKVRVIFDARRSNRVFHGPLLAAGFWRKALGTWSVLDLACTCYKRTWPAGFRKTSLLGVSTQCFPFRLLFSSSVSESFAWYETGLSSCFKRVTSVTVVQFARSWTSFHILF